MKNSSWKISRSESQKLLERRKKVFCTATCNSGRRKKQRNVRSTGKVPFIINELPDGGKVVRSVQLYEDVYERLKKLEKDNGQYTHYAVLQQLLDDGLSMYGY